jgi:DNA modification methylase
MIHWQDDHLTLYGGDCRAVLAEMPAESVHCVVTSPPYWGLRDYGTAAWDGGDEACDHAVGGQVAQTKHPAEGHATGQRPGVDASLCRKCGAVRIDSQLGLEPTPEAYVENMVAVFREVRRVLRADGTLWLNLGDSYASSPPGNTTKGVSGSSTLHGVNGESGRYRETLDAGHATKRNTVVSGLKPKDLVGIPWRVAFALQADGWYLRSDIIWSKPNPMPESVTDRPTKAHEYLFLLTKSPRYYFDADAVREQADPASAKRYESAFFVGPKHESGGYSANGATHTGGMKPFDGGRNLRSVWTIATEPYGSVKMPRVGPGERAEADDTDRTTSPDCPVHAGPDRPAPKASRDGQRAVFGSVRSPGNGRRHGTAQLDGLVSIGMLPDEDSDAGSSGSPLLVDGDAATPHSTGSHRTALAPATSPHETDAGASSSRTERTGPDAGSAATSARTPESSTAAGSVVGDTATDPSARTPESSSCTCTYWESVSHFAVFPRKLVEPCVKAGCPADGTVLDPFAGSGTTLLVAQALGRRGIGIDLNPDYLKQALTRNAQTPLGLIG